jgi:hypothetical protein
MNGLQNSALHPAGSGLRWSLLSAMVIMFTARSDVNNAIFHPTYFPAAFSSPSEQTPILFLNIINPLAFAMVMQCVFCEVGTDIY